MDLAKSPTSTPFDMGLVVVACDAEGDEQTPHGKQLMVLWSTKDNPLVEVNGIEWKPSGRPGFDEEGGIAMEGMVAV